MLHAANTGNFTAWQKNLPFWIYNSFIFIYTSFGGLGPNFKSSRIHLPNNVVEIRYIVHKNHFCDPLMEGQVIFKTHNCMS